MSIIVPYNINFRDYQLKVLSEFDSGKRKILQLWSRQAGKDFTDWNIMIKEAWLVPGNYYYYLHTKSQAREVIWEGKTKEGRSFLDFAPYELLKRAPLNNVMKLYFKNNSVITVDGVIGSDKWKQNDRQRGRRPKGCVLSEYATHADGDALSVLTPAIDNNDGWVIINSTPNGRNHFFDLCNSVKQDDKWLFSFVTLDEAEPDPVKRAAKIQELRTQGKSEAYIQQEYYCDFMMSVGSYYFLDSMRTARAEGRIGKFPAVTGRPVDTCWDHGRSDGTAVWVQQKLGSYINWLHYYQNKHKDINHYVNYLKELGYTYGTHFLPHESTHQKLGQKTRLPTTEEMFIAELEDQGVTGKVVSVKYKHLQPTVDYARSRFMYNRFDDFNTINGQKHLENYREKMSRDGVLSGSEVHDAHSHGASAFRVGVLGYAEDFYDEYFDRHSARNEHKNSVYLQDDYDPLAGFY